MYGHDHTYLSGIHMSIIYVSTTRCMSFCQNLCRCADVLFWFPQQPIFCVCISAVLFQYDDCRFQGDVGCGAGYPGCICLTLLDPPSGPWRCTKFAENGQRHGVPRVSQDREHGTPWAHLLPGGPGALQGPFKCSPGPGGMPRGFRIPWLHLFDTAGPPFRALEVHKVRRKWAKTRCAAR